MFWQLVLKEWILIVHTETNKIEINVMKVKCNFDQLMQCVGQEKPLDPPSCNEDLKSLHCHKKYENESDIEKWKQNKTSDSCW